MMSEEAEPMPQKQRQNSGGLNEGMILLLITILIAFVGVIVTFLLYSHQQLASKVEGSSNGLRDIQEELRGLRQAFADHEESHGEFRSFLEKSRIAMQNNQGSLSNAVETKLSGAIARNTSKLDALAVKIAGISESSAALSSRFNIVTGYVQDNFSLVNQILDALLQGKEDVAEGLRKVFQGRILFVSTTNSELGVSLHLDNNIEIDFQEYLEAAIGIRLFDAADPDWSSVSNRLAFVSRGPSGQEKLTHDLYVYDFVSQRLAQLTDSEFDVRSPRWNPINGNVVLFSRERRPDSASMNGLSTYDLYVGTVDLPEGPGNNVTAELLNLHAIISEEDSIAISHATWSPDGEWILFAGGEESSRYRLLYRRSSGEGKVSDIPGTIGEYRCSSDWYGNQIVYTASDTVYLRDVLSSASDLRFGPALNLHESDSSVVCPSFYDSRKTLYSVTAEGVSEVSIWDLDLDSDPRTKSSRTLARSSEHAYVAPRPIRLAVVEN
jgi:WD40-like Beta Propeller Repeat